MSAPTVRTGVRFAVPSQIPTLHEAARSGSTIAVKTLISHGDSLRGTEGIDVWTAAHTAAASGQGDVLELILRSEPSLAAVPDRKMNTPLHIAAQYGHAKCARWLLDYQTQAETRNDQGYSPLLIACIKRKPDVLNVLLGYGADAQAQDNEKRTGLHWAALSGYDDIARILLHNHAAPNTPDATGATPLHCAATCGHASVIEVLLKGGASIEDRDQDFATPLARAAKKGNTRALRVLLDAKADHSAKDKNGKTPLHLAASLCSLDCIAALCLAKADVNATDDQGQTPIMLVAAAGNVPCVRTLLQNGAVVTTTDRLQKTVFHHAAVGGSGEIIRLLTIHAREQGATATLFTSPDLAGSTPLALAASNDQVDATNVLMSLGGDAKDALRLATGSSKLLLEKALRTMVAQRRPNTRDSTRPPEEIWSNGASRPSTAGSHNVSLTTAHRAVIDRILQSQQEEQAYNREINAAQLEYERLVDELEDIREQSSRLEVQTEEFKSQRVEVSEDANRLQRQVDKAERSRISPYLGASKLIVQQQKKPVVIAPQHVIQMEEARQAKSVPKRRAGSMSPDMLPRIIPEAGVESPLEKLDSITLIERLVPLRKEHRSLVDELQRLQTEISRVSDTKSQQVELKQAKSTASEAAKELMRLRTRLDQATALRDKTRGQLQTAEKATGTMRATLSNLEQRLKAEGSAAAKDATVASGRDDQLIKAKESLKKEEADVGNLRSEIIQAKKKLSELQKELAAVRDIPTHLITRAQHVEVIKIATQQMWALVEAKRSQAEAPDAVKGRSPVPAYDPLSKRETLLHNREKTLSEEEANLAKEEDAEVMRGAELAAQDAALRDDEIVLRRLEEEAQLSALPISTSAAATTKLASRTSKPNVLTTQSDFEMREELEELQNRRSALDASIREARQQTQQINSDIEQMERALVSASPKRPDSRGFL